MAREQYGQERAEPTTAVGQAAATESSQSASTQFVTAGAVPPVETAQDTQTATASQRAYGTGMRKLEALLATGTPKSEDVAGIIDAHRDEHDALLAVVNDRLGTAFADTVRTELSHVRASMSRRELVAGDPGDPASGYVVVSQREGGARWRTADGDFTGTAGRDGLDSRYRLDQRDALHAHVGKDRTGTLAWERDGQSVGELYGRYGSGRDYEAGVRRNVAAGDGTVTGGLRHRVDGLGATDGAYAIYHGTTTTAEGAVGVRNGQLAESLALSRNFGGGYSGSAQVAHGAEGTTGSIAGQYADATRRVDGSIARGLDSTSLHLGASEQLSAQQSISGALDHVQPDHGASQSTLRLGERYRDGNVIHGLDLEVGSGTRDYMRTTGSVDAQLAPHVYGGAFGTSEIERGHSATAQLGASLTFTSSEKTALTLAGLIDQDGNLETRLQFDVFKSRIENIADLDSHKKSALVSVFLSYTQGSDQRRLDGRFGAPQLETGSGSRVTAGIRIKF
jgi:hypothetical protein